MAAAAEDSKVVYNASALLAFKGEADLDGKLIGISLNNSSGVAFCQWSGVRCGRGRVVRVVFQGWGLSGGFAPGTLSELLTPARGTESRGGTCYPGRFLIFPVWLGRLKFLFLDAWRISGWKSNLLNGPVPASISLISRHYSISLNRLSGPFRYTRLYPGSTTPSFFSNKGLCGKIVGKEMRILCSHFFPVSISRAKPPPPYGCCSVKTRGGSKTPPGYTASGKNRPTNPFYNHRRFQLWAFSTSVPQSSVRSGHKKVARGSGNQISSSSAPNRRRRSSSSATTTAARIEEEDEEKLRK
nr:probable inactive receptor kinase At5g67200 [Ipomoea batatas]